MDTLTIESDRLTSFEKESYSAAELYVRARESETDPKTTYSEVLRSARWSILQRLVRGLLRESLDSLSEPIVCSPGELTNESPLLEGTAPPLSELGSDSFRDPVRSLPDSCSKVALLPFPTAETLLFVSIADVHGFDRFRLAAPITSITPSSSTRITHPSEVVELLDREQVFPNPEQAETFRDEVGQSVANLALALFAKRIGVLPSSTNGARFDASALDVASLERLAAVQAHPVHPCAKTRLGMDALDSVQYAAEFAETIDLRFVGVDDAYTFETAANDGPSLTRTVRETFDGLEPAFRDALPPSKSPDEYSLLPVHPWQFRHTLPELFADEYEDSRIVPISQYTYPATPLLSFRTLAPHRPSQLDGTDQTDRTGRIDQTDRSDQTSRIDSPDRGDRTDPLDRSDLLPHVKLPVNVLKTSRVRVLPPENVYDGPRVSELLESIHRTEPFERLGFLSEFAGACYHPDGRPSATDSSSETASQLSALLRTNPYSHPLVGEADCPVTVGSLLATPVGEQRPVVCSLVEQYARAEGIPRSADAVYPFLDAYVDALVPGLLRLMCKYGIGPEAHLQNTSVVFDSEGRPSGALIRDFGGFRIHTPRLEQQGYALDTYPESSIDSDEREMYEMYNALFQTHLGELLVALVEHFDVDEAECWNRVRRACQAAFDGLRNDSTVPDDRIERDESKLFGESVSRRALTRMRLLGEEKSLYHSVSNPLAR